MSFDLSTPPTSHDWERPQQFWPSLTAATRQIDPPLAVIELDALRHNAHDMLRRAAGKPIRIASKSVRVRGILHDVLALPGYHGVLAYTLPEAIWLAAPAGSHPAVDDIVVGYPTVDRAAIQELAASAALASRVTLMVDSMAQLDLIDSVVPPNKRERIRLCLELDASWNAPAMGHVGVWRSPVYTPDAAASLAARIAARPGFTLVGMMG
jgi:D-serine deaminase-like pyridoxal phosphate-dependent protein